KEVSAQAEAEFRQAARRAAGKAEWRLAMDGALAAVSLSARYADLVVAAQPEPGDGRARALSGELVLSVGRPVLFVPYAGRFTTLGKRILVAWNASREAARAVSDALPLLARADSVQLVAFDPASADHGEVPAADVALYLARHGVKATAARQSATSARRSCRARRIPAPTWSSWAATGIRACASWCSAAPRAACSRR